MKSKLSLLLGALILVAFCGYFFISTPSATSKRTPSDSQNQVPQIASTVNGSSQIEKSGKPATTPPVTIPMSLTIGKMSLPLVFPDAEASPELRQVVARDLQLIYGHLNGHEVVRRVGTFPQVMVKGQAVEATKLLTFTGSGRFCPRPIDGEIGYVGTVDGHEGLLISVKVVAAYSEAIDRRAAQPAAYREIDHFVDALNLLDGSKSIEDADQLFVVDPEVSRQFDEIGAKAFSQQFAGRKYRAPSLLEIVDGTQISERYKGSLVGKLYNMTQEGMEDSMPPIIFDQGRWKFLIVSPPT